MSFDVKIGKINHGGTETQRRSQISDFRRQEERGRTSGGRGKVRSQGSGVREGKRGGGGDRKKSR